MDDECLRVDDECLGVDDTSLGVDDDGSKPVGGVSTFNINSCNFVAL